MDARFYDARCPGNRIIFDLIDGRSVEVPIEWFPLLQAAPKEARSAFVVENDGRVMAWPALGERVSVDAVMMTHWRAPLERSQCREVLSRGGHAERAVPFSLPEKSGGEIC